MALITPIVVGPLTEWSGSILVKGCLPGARIVVSAVGPAPRKVAEGTAGGGADRVPLLAGEKLQAQDRLIVWQGLGGEASADTPSHLAVPVAPAPPQYGTLVPLAFRTRLYPCGRAVWLAGAVPGALVQVTDGGQLIASGRANESGDARLGFVAGTTVGPNASLTAWQEAPPGFPAPAGTPKQTTAAADLLPAPWGEQLPVPILTGPAPKGCDGSVPVGGIIDGADVTIRRASDGSSETATFDLSQLRFDLFKPLDSQGDRLEITQELRGCQEWQPSEPLVVDVGPAKKPGVPVLYPPCAGSTDVYAAGLEPGALVTLTFLGEEYRGMAPPDESSFVFRIARLTAGGTVTVVQEKCGLKSDPANIQGIPASGPAAPPDVEEPLYACGRAVRVRGKPGTWLQVWGDSGSGPGPISAQVYSTGSNRIYVAPHLIEWQAVWVAYLGCGDETWHRSPVHTVQPAPDLGPPQISVPLVEGAQSVTVDAIPGAQVEVYSISGSPIKVQLIGSGVVDPLGRAVYLWRPLTTKELVYPVQYLCGNASRAGAARNVIPNRVAFHLGAPLRRASHQTATLKDLVCLWAVVVCRHDGGWEYEAELENEEEEADVSFDLQFELQSVNPPFGLVLPGDLSAAGDGEITKTGMRIHGIPPKKKFSRTGHFAGFRDPTYWAEVYQAAHTFKLFPAWKNYLPTPEEPDYEDKDDDKKPGTNK